MRLIYWTHHRGSETITVHDFLHHVHQQYGTMFIFVHVYTVLETLEKKAFVHCS
jgi:hypothetical protein